MSKKKKGTKKQVKRLGAWRGKIIPIAVLVVLALFYGIGSGYVGYGMAYIRCGKQPVIATNFAAAYSYVLPGEKSYSPDVFSRYYCSQAEAEKAGFHPRVGTEANRIQEQERKDRQEQENKMLLEKRDYIVYAPNTPRFSYDKLRVSDIHGEIHTFYRLKKDGTVVASIRQSKVGSEYEICHNAKYRCEVTGIDTQGREVKRQYPRQSDDTTFTLSIRIGNTFINLENASGDFTIDEAIDVLGSLKEME